MAPTNIVLAGLIAIAFFCAKTNGEEYVEETCGDAYPDDENQEDCFAFSDTDTKEANPLVGQYSEGGQGGSVFYVVRLDTIRKHCFDNDNYGLLRIRDPKMFKHILTASIDPDERKFTNVLVPLGVKSSVHKGFDHIVVTWDDGTVETLDRHKPFGPDSSWENSDAVGHIFVYILDKEKMILYTSNEHKVMKVTKIDGKETTIEKVVVICHKDLTKSITTPPPLTTPPEETTTTPPEQTTSTKSNVTSLAVSPVLPTTPMPLTAPSGYEASTPLLGLLITMIALVITVTVFTEAV